MATATEMIHPPDSYTSLANVSGDAITSKSHRNHEREHQGKLMVSSQPDRARQG
jgi:hypothetical protein